MLSYAVTDVILMITLIPAFSGHFANGNALVLWETRCHISIPNDFIFAVENRGVHRNADTPLIIMLQYLFLGCLGSFASTIVIEPMWGKQIRFTHSFRINIICA